MSSPLEIDPATAILTLNHSSKVPSFSTLSSLSNVPRSTIGHRARGRISNSQKGINQQYLTPAEESVLVSYFLRMSNNGYPLPVKFAGSLAHVIALHRILFFIFRFKNVTVMKQLSHQVKTGLRHSTNAISS